MNKYILLLLSFLISLAASAQVTGSVYNILKLSTSAHAVALGGENITVVEDNPTAGWSNPALYSGVSDNSLGLSYMNYTKGINFIGAQYVKAFGDKHTAAFQAQYLGFGKMNETDVRGNIIGNFSAKDIVIGAAYSYLFSERWAGGVTFHTVYSKYAEYSAVALAVDLGLNYFNEEKDLSLSATLRNFGHEVKTFHDVSQKVPYDLQIGITQGFKHAPVRISITMTDLTRWKSDFYFSEKGVGQLKFGQKLMNHFIVGFDILPINSLYISAAYNFRRAYEMKAAGKSRAAGLSFGAGIDIWRIKAGVSYARYHVAASAIMFNVAYSI